MENGCSIRLQDLWRIICTERKIIGGVIVSCILLSLLLIRVIPKQYTSTMVLQARTMGDYDVNTMAMIGLSQAVISMKTENYLERMKTRAVIEPVINQMEWQDGEKPDAVDFLRKYLSVQNKIGTNLIRVTGKGRTPQEAQQIAKGVVENFLQLQKRSNEETQDFLDEYFNDFLAETRSEAERAIQKQTVYLNSHKISIGDSAQSFSEKIMGYNRAIRVLKTETMTAQAQKNVADQRLREEKINQPDFAIKKDKAIQEMRAELVKSELSAVDLEQKLSEYAPEVVKERQRIQQLKRTILTRVEVIVGENSEGIDGTVVPVLAMREKAEVEADVAVASELAISAKRDEEIKQMAQGDTIEEYLRLDSDAKIKQEVYADLYRCYQQDKVQMALGALDIQVIDDADLPSNPSGPKAKLIVSAVCMFGILFFMMYGFIKYNWLRRK